MTQEEKELLLKDLCARLPYKVKCRITKKGVVRELKPMDNGINIPVNQVCDITLKKTLNTDIINDFDNDNIVLKPYLRPMSSMTEEEKQWSRWYQQDAKSDNFMLYMSRYVEWLDSNHFDWRTDGNGKTLIEKGLALEAPEGMYA